jgi:hypothetical protein
MRYLTTGLFVTLMSIGDRPMITERYWTGTNRGKAMYLEKGRFYCHFVHHKSHILLPWIETRPPRLVAGDWTAWAVALSEMTYAQMVAKHENSLYRVFVNCKISSGSLASLLCSFWFVVVLTEIKFYVVSDRF